MQPPEGITQLLIDWEKGDRSALEKLMPLVYSFAWSHDGKQLACTRGALVRDAILITDLK